ncbi:hypothetical protein D3C81_1572860 [compost metagenome]
MRNLVVEVVHFFRPHRIDLLFGLRDRGIEVGQAAQQQAAGRVRRQVMACRALAGIVHAVELAEGILEQCHQLCVTMTALLRCVELSQVIGHGCLTLSLAAQQRAALGIEVHLDRAVGALQREVAGVFVQLQVEGLLFAAGSLQFGIQLQAGEQRWVELDQCAQLQAGRFLGQPVEGSLKSVGKRCQALELVTGQRTALHVGIHRQAVGAAVEAHRHGGA